MNISDAKDGDEIHVGGICNYYGGLLIMRSKGRFYWAIEDYSYTEFEQIPESLYNELFKYNDFEGGQRMKTINLTDEQMELLKDTLGNHMDMGPQGYGWKSDELRELINVIDRQVDTKGLEDKE